MNKETMTSKEAPREGKTTEAVEHVTAKIPSIFWLSLAVGSMVLSASLAVSKKGKNAANFVGLWVPSLLIIGLYNKLVKQHGSDFQAGA